MLETSLTWLPIRITPTHVVSLIRIPTLLAPIPSGIQTHAQ